jgi:hypothetical protein
MEFRNYLGFDVTPKGGSAYWLAWDLGFPEGLEDDIFYRGEFGID